MKVLSFTLPGLGRKSANGQSQTITTDQLIRALQGAFSSKSGQHVTYLKALQVATVIACVRSISEGLASCPLRLYRRKDRTLSEAKDHPAYDLTATQPNDLQTAFEWREGMVAMAALSGRGISEITRGVGGYPLELLPYLPSQLIPKQTGFSIEYPVRLADGTSRNIQPKNALPLWGPGFGAPIGADIVWLARETIGLQLANEELQAVQAASGLRQSGFFTIKSGIPTQADQKQEWLKTLSEKFGGTQQAGKNIIVEGDIDWKSMVGQTNVEAQILETRRFLIEDTCRAFRVFPQMVGAGNKEPTNASAEQFFTHDVVQTKLPWAKRFEDRLNLSLLSLEERKAGYFFKHNLQGLLRGDSAGRAALYKAMRECTALSPNEIREFEEMEEITSTEFTTPFDDPRMPLNTNPLPKGTSNADQPKT